jgi:hypothetical protein
VSSVIVRQSAVRKVAQAAIDWFDANAQAKVDRLWREHERRQRVHQALPWWRRLFRSKPVAPDVGDFWSPSEECRARNQSSYWRDKAEELLTACTEEDGNAVVGAQTWTVLVGWARHGGLK